MALIDIHSLVVGTPELEQRFCAARLKAAWDVINEDAGTPSHAARLVWADKIVTDYFADKDKEYRRFLSNATIQSSGAASTDNDISFVVASFLNTYAGV